MHAPDYQVTGEEMQLYESVRNPMRVKDLGTNIPFTDQICLKQESLDENEGPRLVGTRRSVRQRNMERLNYQEEGSEIRMAETLTQEHLVKVEAAESTVVQLPPELNLKYGHIETQKISNNTVVGFISIEKVRLIRLNEILTKFHIE